MFSHFFLISYFENFDQKKPKKITFWPKFQGFFLAKKAKIFKNKK